MVRKTNSDVIANEDDSEVEKEKEVVGNSNVFLMVFDEITESSAKDAIQFILENMFSPKPPSMMNFLINSPGGDLHSAFAIIDVMSSSTIPIRTIGLGQIASAGLMIFMAGTKGQRILTPNTSIMSHRFSAGGTEGKEQELFAIQKEYDLTSDRIYKHYKKHTGLPEKHIRKFLLPPHDVYLNAEEALAAKLCDKVALI